MAGSPEYYWFNAPPIIVDDSDPAIRYNGLWHVATTDEILSAFESDRLPLFDTLHVLPSSNGSFSYDFIGSGISVYAPPIDSNIYTVQCFVDGNQLQFNSNFANVQSAQNQPACDVAELPYDVVHTISVMVYPPQSQQDTNGPLAGFALDYLLIEPGLDATPWNGGKQDVYLSLLHSGTSTISEPTLNYGLTFYQNGQQIADVSRGWKYDFNNGFYTITPGSQFNITFTGICLWWYGFTNNTALDEPFAASLRGNEFSATFAIDGGGPSTFSQAVLPQSPSQSYQFRTPVLQYATHQIEVVYQGSNESLPLTLQALIIQKTTHTDAPNGTISPLPPTSPSKVPGNTSPHTENGHRLGKMAGGIAGGVTFLLLLVCGVCVLSRWISRRRQLKQTDESSTDLAPEPFPVSSETTARIVVPRKARASQDGIEHPDTQPLQPPPSTKWSRRHTFPFTRDCMPDSLNTTLQEKSPAGPSLGRSTLPNSSQRPLATTGTVEIQPGAQIVDALLPATQTEVISTGLRVEEGERDDGSELQTATVSDLPPAYTIH